MSSIDFKTFQIPRSEVEIRRSRSGGAGGQHVNKVETKIELRLHVDSAYWIPVDVRRRLKIQQGNRINKEGEFLLSCDETRSLARNEEICFERLRGLIGDVWTPPKYRVKTRPTRSSKEKRLTAKKKDGAKKQTRKVSKKDY